MYRSAKFTLGQIENAKSEMLCKSRRETWRVSPHWCSAELVLAIALGWMEEKRLWLGKQCYLWNFSHQKDTSSLEIVHILKQTHFFGKFQLSACLGKHNIWILLSLNTWQWIIKVEVPYSEKIQKIRASFSLKEVESYSLFHLATRETPKLTKCLLNPITCHPGCFGLAS